MSVIWPLFDIRITTPRLEMRLPTDDEIHQLGELAVKGVHSPGSEAFGLPWTDAAPDDMQRSMLQHHWKSRGGWHPDSWDFSPTIFVGGEPAGSQSARGKQFSILRSVDSGSWLGAEWQGRGLGTEMREAILHFSFETLGALMATSAAHEGNQASVAVSAKTGYVADGEYFDVLRGERRRAHRYRISREQWLERRRDDITVTGMTPDALALFGVAD